MTSAMCSGQVTFTLCGQGLQMLEGAAYQVFPVGNPASAASECYTGGGSMYIFEIKC